MVLISNTKVHHKLHLKAMIIFKGVCGNLYYTQYTLLNNVRQLLFFLLETITHRE